MAATEYVVLVDHEDREIGLAEKMEAHQKGLLHRAFSVLIVRKHQQQEELLLQQRALSKYHSPGLWTNACCSHPRAQEDIIAAGKRRLKEELGITTELQHIGWFEYLTHFENGLSENEIDHVLVGKIDADTAISPNPEEVAAIRWVTPHDLQQELSLHPEKFTPWLGKALELWAASE